MNSLFSRSGATALKKQVVHHVSERGLMLASKLYNQFNDLHLVDYYSDIEIEKLLLRQRQLEVTNITKPHIPEQYKDLTYFSPSGASKCKRDLYYKALKSKKDVLPFYPYHRRWTRNSTAVHEVVQRDLLYAEKVLKDPGFNVLRTDQGLPCWEQNIKTYKVIEHDGEIFGLYGMSDGILVHNEDGTKIGFEFKTKSTTIGAVGNYKMKDAAEYHKIQCTAYAILFDVWEHLIVYESVAKDGWNKGADAKLDLRVFYHEVTKEDVKALLDKYASISRALKEGQEPPREDEKCLFCTYKTLCNGTAAEMVVAA